MGKHRAAANERDRRFAGLVLRRTHSQATRRDPAEPRGLTTSVIAADSTDRDRTMSVGAEA
jgi:hypothetical protein